MTSKREEAIALGVEHAECDQRTAQDKETIKRLTAHIVELTAAYEEATDAVMEARRRIVGMKIAYAQSQQTPEGE